MPERFTLDRDELRRLLARELEEAGTADLGGEGGGVQVLSAMEARGRTFEHLFLIGLNRDVFPRGVREDPLLPDDLRRVLQRVLPDVPVKLAGFDEERWLFAHLLSASPAVTLSWQGVDEDGKALSPSPLLEMLRGGTCRKVPPLWSARRRRARVPRTAGGAGGARGAASARRRHWAGLAGGAGARWRLGTERESALAAARLAVLDEIDPDLRTPEGRAAARPARPLLRLCRRDASPGEGPAAAGPLRHPPGGAGGLPLAALPRAAAPPGADARPAGDGCPAPIRCCSGNLVHAVLERIVREAGGRRRGRWRWCAVPWPAERDLQAWLLDEASRLLAEEGIFLPGLARALAEQVRPRLDAARDTDWAEGPLPVLRVEDEGSLEVAATPGPHPLRPLPGRPRGPPGRRRPPLDRLQDRQADLRGEDGGHRGAGTSWTGCRPAPISRAWPTCSPRRRAGRCGRYLFLRPDVEEREFAVAPDDRALAEAFRGRGRGRARRLGGRQPSSPAWSTPPAATSRRAARFCAVAEACLRGDSGARLRLFEWADRTQEQAAPSRSPRGSGPCRSGGCRQGRAGGVEEAR